MQNYTAKKVSSAKIGTLAGLGIAKLLAQTADKKQPERYLLFIDETKTDVFSGKDEIKKKLVAVCTIEDLQARINACKKAK